MELIGAFGLTEPDFGSDATSLQTRAVTVEGGVSITGKKRWIGNATSAGVIVVWALDDSSRIRGYLLETGLRLDEPTRRTTVPGLSIEKIEGKVTRHNQSMAIDAE